MKTILEPTRRTLGMCAVASLLAGCGVPAVQNALPATSAQGAAGGVAPNGWGGGHKGSWMAPGAKHEDLVYVSEALSNKVTVYAVATHKLVGVLAGINQPFGLCADPGGNVWIVAWGKNQIFKYAHAGTKPLKVLTVPGPEKNLYGCAVDPTTGNLAVTNWGYDWDAGNVFIFTHATGKAKAYSGYGIWFYYGCTYDDKGNLFADGRDAYVSDVFSLAELRKGRSVFTRITLLPAIAPVLVEGVQWDGEYVAIGDSGSLLEYQVQGKYAYGKRRTFLTVHWPVGMFWIGNLAGTRKVVAPDYAGSPNLVQYWKYPAGGVPTATIDVGLDSPFGVTVSKAMP